MLETKLLNFGIITDPRGNIDFLREAILTLPKQEFKAGKRSKNPAKIEKLDALFVLGDITGMVLDKETEYKIDVKLSENHSTRVATTADQVVRDARKHFQMELEANLDRYNALGIRDVPELIRHYKHQGHKDRWMEQKVLIPEFERLIGLKERGRWLAPLGEAYDIIAFGYNQIKGLFEKSSIPVYASADSVFFEQLFPEKYWLHHAQLPLGGLLVKALNTSNPQEIPDEYQMNPLRRGEKELPLEDWDPLQGHILLMYDMPLSMHRQLQASKDKLVIVGRRTEFDDSKIGQPDEEYSGNLYFCEDPGVVSFYSLQGDLGVRVRYVWDGDKFERKAEEPINLKDMRAKASTVKRKRTQRDAMGEVVDMWSVWNQMRASIAQHPSPVRKGKEIKRPQDFLDHLFGVEGELERFIKLVSTVTGETEKTLEATFKALGIYEWYEAMQIKYCQDKGITNPQLISIEDKVTVFFDLATKKLVETYQSMRRTSTSSGSLRMGYERALHGLAMTLRQTLGVPDFEVEDGLKKFQEEHGLPPDQPLNEQYALMFFERTIIPLLQKKASEAAEERVRVNKEAEAMEEENKKLLGEKVSLEQQLEASQKDLQTAQVAVSDLKQWAENTKELALKYSLSIARLLYLRYHRLPAEAPEEQESAPAAAQAKPPEKHEGPTIVEANFVQRLVSALTLGKAGNFIDIELDREKCPPGTVVWPLQYSMWLENVRKDPIIAAVADRVLGKIQLKQPIAPQLAEQWIDVATRLNAFGVGETLGLVEDYINAHQANKSRQRQSQDQYAALVKERGLLLETKRDLEHNCDELDERNKELDDVRKSLETQLVDLRAKSAAREEEYNRYKVENVQLAKDLAATKNLVAQAATQARQQKETYEGRIKDLDARLAAKQQELDSKLAAKQQELETVANGYIARIESINTDYASKLAKEQKQLSDAQAQLADERQRFEREFRTLDTQIKRDQAAFAEKLDEMNAEKEAVDRRAKIHFNICQTVLAAAQDAEKHYNEMRASREQAYQELMKRAKEVKGLFENKLKIITDEVKHLREENTYLHGELAAVKGSKDQPA